MEYGMAFCVLLEAFCFNDSTVFPGWPGHVTHSLFILPLYSFPLFIFFAPFS
jgi:hypothetical protein